MPDSDFAAGNRIDNSEIDQDSPIDDLFLAKVKNRDIEVMEKVLTQTNYAAGDVLIASADTERTSTENSYQSTPMKEIKIYKPGTLRIKFYLYATGSGTIVGTARIYRNGSGIGTERVVTNPSGYTTFSEDVSGWSAGDSVQIFAYAGGSDMVKVRNFRLYAAIGEPEVVTD